MIAKITQMSWAERAGWLGMVSIHGATMPVTIRNIAGWSNELPPFSMVFLVWLGLALFLWRAVERKDVLYIVSNAIGFFLNSILLALIVLPFY
jgi:hypothetical protein